MKEQPELETKRLVLRPLMAQDDLSVRELANDPKIAELSLWSMDGAGWKTCRYWINGTHESWKGGTRAEFAIERKNSGGLAPQNGFIPTEVPSRFAAPRRRATRAGPSPPW